MSNPFFPLPPYKSTNFCFVYFSNINIFFIFHKKKRFQINYATVKKSKFLCLVGGWVHVKELHLLGAQASGHLQQGGGLTGHRQQVQELVVTPLDRMLD